MGHLSKTQNNDQRSQKPVCEETLEEMGLFIPENVSGRQSQKFPNVASEQMKVKKKMAFICRMLDV